MSCMLCCTRWEVDIEVLSSFGPLQPQCILSKVSRQRYFALCVISKCARLIKELKLYLLKVCKQKESIII